MLASNHDTFIVAMLINKNVWSVVRYASVCVDWLIPKDHNGFCLMFIPMFFRTCSHGGGGPRVGEVPRLGGVTNLSIQSLLFV